MRARRRLARVLTLAAPVGLGMGLGVGLGATAAAHQLERPGGGGGFGGGGGGFGGGGGSFSSGSSSWSSSSSSWSSSSSSYSGGGGDLGGATLALMIVGLGISVTSFLVKFAQSNDGWSSGGSVGIDYSNFRPVQPRKPTRVTLAPLREQDPNFSQILLEDFLYELYARAQEARGSADELGMLAPYLNEEVRRKLLVRNGREVLAVSGVIVGSMTIDRLRIRDGWAALDVTYETNYTETYASDAKIPATHAANPLQEHRPSRGQLAFYAKERWHFVRRVGVHSRTPDETRGFNCPSCGAPVERSQYDACSHCGSRHGTGEFDWLCNGIRLDREETRGPALTTSAQEVGTFDPTVVDPRRDQALAALHEHDPEFSETEFRARVEMIYHELNAAWSSLQWKDAQPFLSDRLWMSMQYWIGAYQEQHLRNVMLDARVDRMEIAKVESDPFFHAITIRLWATAKDHTVHAQTGHVVCGSATQFRDYSEYWTFIRSAERRGHASTDKQCPSCGAELKINMAGNCEFCGVKVTAGQFDWVLSKIEQDEAYRG